MITLPRKEDEEKVFEAIDDWDNLQTPPDIRVYVGGTDVSHLLVSGEWGQSADGPAIALTTDLAVRLPPRYNNAPTVVSVDVNGVSIPQMVGRLARPEPGQTRTTSARVAASMGGLLGKVHVDPLPDMYYRRLLEYNHATPERIVWETLAKLPYDLSRVSVETVGSPLLTYMGFEEAFKPEQYLNDILMKVQESVPYVFKDNAFGGHDATLYQGLATAGEPIMLYDADDIEWPQPVLDMDQFTAVEVFRINEDGSDAYRERVDVYFPEADYPPVLGQTLQIPFGDTTADGAQNAKQHAYNTAVKLQRGSYTAEAVLPFMPLISHGDPFLVQETTDDIDGTWQRTWLCVVEAYSHPFEQTLSTRVTVSTSIMEERWLAGTAIDLNALSPSRGVPVTPMPPIFEWREDTNIHVETATTPAGIWAYLDENDDLQIEPANSQGYAYLDGSSDLILEVTV